MERQMETCLEDIRKDHLLRYEFAKKYLVDNNFTKNILDAGCGIGYGSHILADAVENIDSVELSEEAYESYKLYFSKPNINFMCGDIFKAAYKEKYDAIVCFEFLEHIVPAPEAVKLYSKMTNVLISSVPNEEVRPYLRPPVNEFHVRHYTPFEYEELLAEGGFKIVELWNQTSGGKPIFRKGPRGKFMISVASK